MRIHTPLIFCVAFTVAGCASAPQSVGAASDSDATRITAEQIAQVQAPTAYEVIDRLHRPWWRDKSPGAEGNVVVYWSSNQKIDDGSKDVLRQVPASDVLVLEHLKSADAVARFGSEAKGGAIVVTRR
jgi:hypothetical protein